MMIYGWVVEKIDKVYGMDNIVDENGEFDYSSFKKLVLKHFDFKITCIYWGDQNLRNSEGEQIALGRVGKADIASKKLLKQHGIIHGFNDGRISELLKKYSLDPKMVGMGLNDSQAAGLGSHKGDSLADQIVLVMAFYVSQGYSHREIFKKLKSEYRYRFGFDAYKNEFRNYFGSLANAYKEFRNPLILKMKADGYSQGEITEFFPRLRIFDDKEFIELAELGLHLGEIAKRLGWDPEYLRKKLVGNLILERFPDLQQYKFTGGKTGAGWEDLQYYLLAKKILTGIYIGKKKTIIKSSMPYLKDDMFDSICEIVLGGKYQELIDEARKALLSIIIYDINPKSIGDVSRDPRNWMSRSILGEKLRKFFMGDALVKKVLQRDGAFYYDALDIGKIALVGNLLKNLYEKGASDNEILTTIGSAYTIEDIKELTAIIWGKTPEEVRKILYSG